MVRSKDKVSSWDVTVTYDQCRTDTKHFFLSPLPGLPDEKGRVQILNIHTAMMRQHNLLSGDVDIKELAVETKNYSGAELEGLVRAAQSTAMNRHIKVCVRVFVCVRARYINRVYTVGTIKVIGFSSECYSCMCENIHRTRALFLVHCHISRDAYLTVA